MYYFSNEIVFRGHPDKVADQISDYIYDSYRIRDKNSHCGIEVVGGKGKIFVTGEVKSKAKVDIPQAVRDALYDVGYDHGAYEIINNIGVQSPDIVNGIKKGGAGDQGMMFGYACRQTPQLLPKAQVILTDLAKWYDLIRKTDERFLPDGKAQITGIYENLTLIGIKDFTISYQNTEVERTDTDSIIKEAAIRICKQYGIERIDEFHINPSGKFLIGGFDGDAGLTGRKLVVDTYNYFARVGGGAFSGKDPTKVDRSGAYKARQLARRYLLANNNASWCEVQLSYAIGLEKPLGIYVRTDLGDVQVANSVYDECKPNTIIDDLDLKNVNYYDTAKFGHFGNSNFNWEK